MQKVYLKQQEDASFLICGVINFNTVSSLLNNSEQVFKNTDHIVIDFANLYNADSSAVALILEWQRFVNKNNRTLALRNMSPAIMSLISISNLERLSPLWNN